RPRERHGRAQQDAAAEAKTEPTGGQIDQHDQHQGDDHLSGPQPPQPPVPADPGALGFGHKAQPTLRRRRRTIPTPIATAATTTTSTSSGSSRASTPRDTENTSSTVEATGAPTPAVDRFTPARSAALARWVDSASTTPTRIGTMTGPWSRSAGWLTDGVWAVEPAAKTMPPDVGRTTVCSRSLTWSTEGTLSATTSTSSSTASTTSATSPVSQAHCWGRVTRLVNRASSATSSNGT